MQQHPKIRDSLKEIVSVYQDYFISYKATEKIDKFYQDFSYIFMMSTQIFDDFDDNDEFNGIKYKEYIDVIQYLFKATLMHRDCCMALAEKTSHKIYLRDILTYCYAKEPFLKSLADWFDWDIPKLENIISCLTINKDNYEQSLSYPGASPAPLFEIGPNVLMRSAYGCMDMPVQFLNRELKRKYYKDYFTSINNREKRFRDQLYTLFDDPRFILIHDNIEIKVDGRHTDLDAVVFDKLSNHLALFQLKWQDTFSTSMTERFSRISNLIPKSTEWIDKIIYWLEKSTEADVLKKLKIENSKKIEDVYLFVIARNHVHFTGQKLDERAIWASWYQIVEAISNIKDISNANPLGSFGAKLKALYPENRAHRDSLPKFENYSFRFSKYKIDVVS